MPIFANKWPDDFDPGCDFVQIEDDEFTLVSEPSGLIAVAPNNASGYLTLAAAKRLHSLLAHAIANSEAERPDAHIFAMNDPSDFDDGMPF